MLSKLPWMVRDVGTSVAKRLVTLTWIPKTLCTLTSLCLFSMVFSIHFLRCWKKEFFLTIKSFFNWWSFPLFSWPQCLIQVWYCKEISIDYFLGFKLDSLHFSIYPKRSVERPFPGKVILPINGSYPHQSNSGTAKMQLGPETQTFESQGRVVKSRVQITQR